MLTNTTNVDRYLITSGTIPATYTIDYPFWDKAEIEVVLTRPSGETTLTQGTDYTVSEPNGENGYITPIYSTSLDAISSSSPWYDATKVTIARVMPLQQQTDLINGSAIDADSLERALDLLTAQIQQINEASGRSIKFTITEAGEDITLPDKATRIGSGSGTIMGFGSDGTTAVVRDLATFDSQVTATANNAAAAIAAKEAAEASETNAKASENAAKASENASAVSESNAQAYASNAESSKSAAETAETNASSSASAAASSAEAAEESKDEAIAFKDEVKAAKEAAQASEANAATSESNAAASESNASASATSAGNSATSATNSKLDAEAWAVGQRNGTDVESTDPAYHNNAKYYAEVAGGMKPLTDDEITAIANEVYA